MIKKKEKKGKRVRVTPPVERASELPVATNSHALDLLCRPRVHLNRPHKADMDPEPSVLARALQADQRAERDRRPLRVARPAVRARLVTLDGADLGLHVRGHTVAHGALRQGQVHLSTFLDTLLYGTVYCM